MRTLKRSSAISIERLLTYFALSSVFALFVLTYNYNEVRKQQHASIRITQETSSANDYDDDDDDDIQSRNLDNESNNQKANAKSYKAYTQQFNFDFSEDSDDWASLYQPKTNIAPLKTMNMPTFGTVSFQDPGLAYRVLSQLDIFEPVDDSYFEARGKGQSKYDQPWLGLVNDDEYCHMHRALFVEDPESTTFAKPKFITSSPPSSIMRSKVIPAIGIDLQPNVGAHAPKDQKEKFSFDLSPDAQIFFSSVGAGLYKEIGKHIGCLGQAVSHIPGHSTLNRKDLAAESALAYSKKYESRPQCLNSNKFFPETWLLYNEEDCRAFFEKFNSLEYLMQKEEKKIVYIRKVGAGSHRGQGVAPVTDEEEAELRSIYRNGALCGAITKNYIMQDYVHNPLLINGRKFDFRMYMLIASSNPMMVYYHDGFLRVSLANYDASSTDKKALLTNLSLNKEIYEEVKEGTLFNGMNEEKLKIAQQWSFDRFLEYLIEAKVVTDPNWLDNYLRPEFKKAMIHLIRMTSHGFLRRSSLYELYGVDFMLDEDLNLWFIEANSGPAFGGYSQPMEKTIVKMLQDHFEIVSGLVKSRMKRVADYVNKIINDGLVSVDSSVKITELDDRINEFKVISRNYFEKEYEPNVTNGFSKIIDENYGGTQTYQGLISEECL